MLQARHLIDDGCCSWFPTIAESHHHVLFGCPRISRLWVEHGCGEMVSSDREEAGCEMVDRWSKLDQKIVEQGCYLAWKWNIWFERSYFIFENTYQPLTILSQRVCRQVEEYKEYNNRIYGQPCRAIHASLCRWSAPLLGSVKIDIDAYLGMDGWVSIAAVARNSLGKVLFASVRRQRIWWPPNVAECKAIMFAVRIARSHGLSDVIVESDALVISRLSKGFFFSDLDSILGDVLFLSKNFNSNLVISRDMGMLWPITLLELCLLM